MAQIHKLKIQGIRSFGPDDASAQSITFTTPITCIVGQNGCGKTTIIESLRFATTGNCPPGTTGGKCFVYDPKLSGQGEVKGQVKLQFLNLKKQTMQITRTLQVSQKLDKLELKTVDPFIDVKTEDGEIETTSGRCMDVNNIMLSNLGISEAILDNVIFCHQEDSCWPMDESKKLKEKFDMIFDATKYNKASDVLCKLRKKRFDQLKIGRQALEFYQEYVGQVREKRKELKKATDEQAEGMASAQEMKQKRAPLEDEYRKNIKTEKHFSELQSQISALETKRTGLEQQQKELAEKITSLHKGSKRQLQDNIKNFHKQLAVKKNEISEHEEAVARLVQKDRDGLNRINQEQTKLGKLQKEEETHQETLQCRLQSLNSIAAELQLNIPKEEPQSVKEMEAALKQVDAGVRAKDKDLQTLKKNLQLEEQKLQKDIDKKRELRVEADQGVKSLETQLADCTDQLRKTKEEISQVDSSVSQMSVLQTRLDRADKEYQEADEQMDCKESQQHIVDTQRQRDRVDAEVSALSDELEELQQASSLQAEADVHRANLKKKEDEVRKIKEKHHDGLVTLFKTLPERGLLNQLESLIKRKESDIKELRSKLDSSQKQQTQVEVERQHQQKKLEELETQLKKNKAAILKECGKKDYDTAVTEVEEAMRKAQDQKGVLDSSDILFRRYVSALRQAKPCCPLCHRDFKAKQESDKLVTELQGKMEQLPAQKVETESSLKELKARHSCLLQLKPVHTRVAELHATEIPELQETIDGTDLTLTSLHTEIEDLVFQLKSPEEQLKIAMGIRSDATVLEQHESEVKKLTREVQRIEQRLPNAGSGRTLVQAQEELRRLRNEVQKLQKEAEAKQRELDNHQKRVNSLREQRNSLKEQLLKITAGAQKRAQLLERTRELQTQMNTLEDAVENAREAVMPARLELEAAEKAKERAQIKNNTTLDNERKTLVALQQKSEQLKRLHAAVESYEARGVARTLDTVRKTVNELQSQREEIMTQRQEIAGRIEELTADLASQQVRERELEDNLKLIEKKEQSEEIDGQLEKLCNEMGTLDFVQLQDSKRELEKKITRINTDLARLDGVQESLKKRVEEIQKELEKDTLKNAEKNYKERMVKNKVLQNVCNDLQMYFSALNSSMIHFHQERMQAVNQIIRELWVSIYKGSDIDYIEIKTETGKTNTTQMRRTYEYRVVMVKHNSELDMRGRCSAGQKMLASLVIRIALAETFSANCGILALDEPTTNLDHNNIESLGASLIELVQSHRFQANFQLIIITHDEDFIGRLSQAGLMSYFYRISRTEQGHSLIKKFKVREEDEDDVE